MEKIILFFLFFSNFLMAKEYTVVFSKNKFNPLELHVSVNDDIVFINQDSFEHAFFSISDPKIFDLGVMGPGEQKKLTFESQVVGHIEVRCALTQNASMDIYVDQKDQVEK